MPRLLLRLRPVALALTFAFLLPGAAGAAGDTKPTPPAGGHDVTKPWINAQVADRVASAKVGKLPARGSVIALRPRARAATADAAAAAPALNREVMGFASADSLDDPSVGFRTWNFGLLSDVAYFGITVNTDGTLVTSDSGFTVWQSSTASNLINAAHTAGTRVLLTLMFLPTAADNATTCQALADASTTTTVNQVRPLVQGIADGIDIDFEASSATCPDGQTLRAKMDAFVQKVRAANLGYLVVDTFAGSAEDTGGFFDIPTLAGSVDALFVMAYGLESNNGPCALCMGPTSPFDGSAPNYTWNVTRAANDYAPWAGQTIMGFPFYGVTGCVSGPNPPANAPVLSPGAHYAAMPYTVFATLPSNSAINSFSEHRDGLDPNGQELWATYFDADPSLTCWREAYWDDQVSLVRKWDLVNQRGFRGAGMFTLDFGGGSPELWNALAVEFGSTPTYQSLGGMFASSPAAASWGANHLDVFAQGLDSALWQDTWNGSSWSGWHSLGGIITAAPAAVSWGPNRIDVFARGNDGALWHRPFANGTWFDWQPLGGSITSAPAVSSWAVNRLDVFARGVDGALWHQAWDGSNWSGWQGLGGQLSAAPGAVSWGPNRIDVFERGTDGALWHMWWSGAWGGPEPQGGQMTASAPAPASTASGLLDVFIPGLDAGVWRKSWNGTSWSGFTGDGADTVWRLGPAAVSQPGSGHVDVFTVGPDDAIWRFVN